MARFSSSPYFHFCSCSGGATELVRSKSKFPFPHPPKKKHWFFLFISNAIVKNNYLSECPLMIWSPIFTPQHTGNLLLNNNNKQPRKKKKKKKRTHKAKIFAWGCFFLASAWGMGIECCNKFFVACGQENIWQTFTKDDAPFLGV